MSLTAKIVTSINLPEQVDVEISDSVRGTTEVLTVDFHAANPAELISMACAVAKHRAIDQYLVSLGVDPHKDVKILDELPQQDK